MTLLGATSRSATSRSGSARSKSGRGSQMGILGNNISRPASAQVLPLQEWALKFPYWARMRLFKSGVVLEQHAAIRAGRRFDLQNLRTRCCLTSFVIRAWKLL